MVNLVFCIAFMLTAYIITIFIYKKRYNTNNLKQNIMLFVIYLSVGIAIGVLYKIYAFDILKTFKALAIISITFITAGIDYREKIIPNEAVVCIIAVACVMMIINAFTNSVEALAIFIDSLADRRCAVCGKQGDKQKRCRNGRYKACRSLRSVS